jgi:hypothetical protein
MKTFSQFLIENKTFIFYHGGNLNLTSDNRLTPMDVDKVPASKRIEYGPGLYLTTSSHVVDKYAKGSRKLYKVYVDQGTEINDVKIDISSIDELKASLGKPKVQKIRERIEGSRFDEHGKVGAYIVLNFCINDHLLRTEKGRKGMRDFLVRHGVDYELHNSPFGWKETMMVLFNTKKISKIEQLDKKQPIEDLHK